MATGPDAADGRAADRASSESRERPLSRRALLRGSAAALAVGLAGCAGVSLRGDAGAAFPRYFPAPGALNRLLYSPTIVRPRRIAGREVPAVARREAARLAADDPLGVPSDRIRLRVDLAQNTTVTAGRFDRTTVLDRLRTAGFQNEGQTSGYAVLRRERDDRETVVAVRSGVAIVAGTWPLATARPLRERVAGVIAAERGREKRYSEVFPPVADVVDVLAGADLAWLIGYPSEARDRLDLEALDGLRASGLGTAVRDGIARWVRGLVFASSAAVHEPTVESWVRRARAMASDGNVEYRQRGRAVVVGWSVAVGDEN